MMNENVLENVIDYRTDLVEVVDTNVLKLTEQKAEALELLVKNVPVREVAEVVGVNASTVYRWMTKEPFKSALTKTKEVVLSELSTVATERLLEMLCSNNLYAQQFAIAQWAKLMATNDINIKVEEKAPTNLEDLLAKFDKQQ